jgi:hypothetical protein
MLLGRLFCLLCKDRLNDGFSGPLCNNENHKNLIMLVHEHSAYNIRNMSLFVRIWYKKFKLD